MEYELKVNEVYVELVHKAVSFYLDKWPGGDPDEQQALITLMRQLDKLKLEVLFDTMQGRMLPKVWNGTLGSLRR